MPQRSTPGRIITLEINAGFGQLRINFLVIETKTQRYFVVNPIGDGRIDVDRGDF